MSPGEAAPDQALAEAEQRMRALLALRFLPALDDLALEVVLAEYDRRGVVEKAAADYVMSCLCNGGIPELAGDINERFRALVEAVRTNGGFRG